MTIIVSVVLVRSDTVFVWSNHFKLDEDMLE